jgi:flagellar biosynthesis/type III secretory pathway protein FliH
MLENRVAEWNRELREEGRLLGLKEGIKKGVKEGRQKGIQEGRQKGIQEGRQKGIQEGRQKGIQEGRQKGIQEGRQAGEALLLLRLLERKFGRLDPQTRKRVRGADAERLLEWGERVLTAQRLEEVFG